MFSNRPFPVPVLALVLALLAGPRGAQQHLTRRVTQPLRSAQLDLATGTVTVDTPPRRRGSGFTTAASLANLDHSGFVGITSATGVGQPCEWIMGAQKGDGFGNPAGNALRQNAGGKSELLTSFAFAYCSSARSTVSGGPGGLARIGFREGYQLGGGNLGTEVGTFNLSGLPAWTGCTSFFGGFACYLLTVSFGDEPLVLDDGPIGYSFQFRQLGTDGFPKTIPFLSCVQSCTGTGPDGMGMIDVMDQYCPAGSLTSSFSFATSPGGPTYTSMSLELREVEPIDSTAVVVPCPGTTQALTPVAPERDGDVVRLRWPLDCTGNADSLALWRVSPGETVDPIQTKWGAVCVDLRPGRGITAPAGAGAPPVFHGGGLVTFEGELPLELDLLGLQWVVQGFCGNSAGTGAVSNVIRQTIGTD